jgi:predicted RNA-binding Zn ribbon-like protein
MNDRELRRVGEQIEPGGRPKAPGRLELLQRFVNTSNHDLPVEWDRLGTPKKAHSWLRGTGLVSNQTRISARDAAQLRELREALRELALANQGIAPCAEALSILRDAALSATLQVDFDRGGRTTLKPRRGGMGQAVATLFAVLHEAQMTGGWTRFKGCRKCGYGFYDQSKNRSAAWCAMSICGNRTKNQAYRRRLSTAVRSRRLARSKEEGGA